MNKKWEFYGVDEETIKDISSKNNISELLATVLANRGITESKEIEKFLNPTRNDFYGNSIICLLYLLLLLLILLILQLLEQKRYFQEFGFLLNIFFLFLVDICN